VPSGIRRDQEIEVRKELKESAAIRSKSASIS